MKWILLALLLTGCGIAQKEYHMKECRKILDLNDQDQGERSCKRQSIWWD